MLPLAVGTIAVRRKSSGVGERAREVLPSFRPGGAELALAVLRGTGWRGGQPAGRRCPVPEDSLGEVPDPDDFMPTCLREFLGEHPFFGEGFGEGLGEPLCNAFRGLVRDPPDCDDWERREDEGVSCMPSQVVTLEALTDWLN